MYWIDTLPDQTIGQVLAGACARFGDLEAFTFPGKRLSFREVDAQSDRAARAFLRLGLGPGDRVVVWMANHPEWAALYFGLLKIGAIAVPLNTRLKPAELSFCVINADAKAFIFKQEITEHGKDYGVLLAEVFPELTSAEPGNFQVARVPRLRTFIDVAASPLPGTLAWDEFLASGDTVSDDALARAEGKVRPGDEALVQYTSGTTSFPKGARLSHAGMLRGGAQTLEWMQVRQGDAFFTVQPFYHSGGSVTSMLAPIITGCRTVTQTYFNSGEALAIMEAEQATVLVGHQPHFIEYINNPTFAQRKLCLERMLVIAPPEIFWMVREKFGVEALVSGYGMTETHMMGTATSLLTDPVAVRYTTNGRPIPGVRLEIRDPDDGSVLGAEEEGEIFLHVPYPMLGYLNEPQLTADVLDADGWYRSGDKGIVGKDGNLRLLGRVRDMIRVGGENLSGVEVEACLLAHPAVKQAVAVAAPDSRLGEVVAGFVELKEGERTTAAELIAHCKARMASFKVPRMIEFVTEWPMSGTGKIQKRLLVPTVAKVATSTTPP